MNKFLLNIPSIQDPDFWSEEGGRPKLEIGLIGKIIQNSVDKVLDKFVLISLQRCSDVKVT